MPIISFDSVVPLLETFNAQDEELYPTWISNREAIGFLEDTMPLFECPDREIMQTYYYRFWAFRKHIKQTKRGYAITEFLPPVPWGEQAYNTIAGATPHHCLEGRWLRDPRFLSGYMGFLLTEGDPYAYTTASLPFSASLLKDVWGDAEFPLPRLRAYIEAWETGIPLTAMTEQQDGTILWEELVHGLRNNGLFFSSDGRDAGELSLGGHGYRPMFNSAMYGNYDAMARLEHDPHLQQAYRKKAEALRQAVIQQLYDRETDFFMVRKEDGQFAKARELYGFAPWFFGLAPEGLAKGFEQLMMTDGFLAPYGLTFAEQRSEGFQLSYQGHECRWDGPVWPFASSLTLKALANLLQGYRKHSMTKRQYLFLLSQYARSQRRTTGSGRILPWIDEDQHPYTGDWIARTCLRQAEPEALLPAPEGRIPERGKEYNHSSFCDLVISGLVGLLPRSGGIQLVPLLPEGTWDWFCVDRLRVHGHEAAVTWDKTGMRYGRRPGLTLWVDGQVYWNSPLLQASPVFTL